MIEEHMFESEADSDAPDPDALPIRDPNVYTQPYDLVVESLLEQIKVGTIYLRPLSDRPEFQRRYVWTNALASRLVESVLLNVPIPPCYLSQNEDYELDVIDGQQRLFSLYRFVENQFALSSLEVLENLNGSRFHQLDAKVQRQLKTHTLRCILITNKSHPELKFDVFQRLNTNTVPLNAQELRNCIYRGSLNTLLKDAVTYEPWLSILGKTKPDKRMRDEELVLRFFAFNLHGITSYRTPLKHWLNEAAKAGRTYNPTKIIALDKNWKKTIDTSLILFEPEECFRRDLEAPSRAINRALFDLVTHTTSKISQASAQRNRSTFRRSFKKLLGDEEFQDLISRAVDHTKRTKRRFELWKEAMGGIF